MERWRRSVRLEPAVAGMLGLLAVACNDGSPSNSGATDGGEKTGGADGAGVGGGSDTGGAPHPDGAGATLGSKLLAKSVAAGEESTCALLPDGRVKCWGQNHGGQLGDGTGKDSNVPVLVSGVANAVAVSAGYGHGCAVLATGTIQCWGRSSLGDGSGSTSLVPVGVAGITNAVAVTCGSGELDGHDCAVLSDGTVKCWGYNVDGALGNGTVNDSEVPVVASGITNAAVVTAAEENSGALLRDGTVLQWGMFGSPNLACPFPTSSLVPVAAAGIVGAIGLATGGTHSCVLLNDGTVRCWGATRAGCLLNGICQRATPYENIDSTEALTVPGLAGAMAIAGGPDYTCVIAAGAVQCWGANNGDRFGTVTLTNSSAPVPVPGTENAAGVTVGNDHACAVLRDGTVLCWGSNSRGQLGDGTRTNSAVPVIAMDAPP
jgi:alpha-tubulin suppressor-like RCC1 family protein